MRTTVVIPNWNGDKWLGECLDSLLLQTVKTTIVVVDNGSIDDSINLVEKKYPMVHLIKLPKNTGFAGGVNTGIRYSLEQGYDAVALLNNDATVDKHWLQELITTLEDNAKIGIATCKLLHTDELHFDSTGDFYSVWGLPFPRARNQKDIGQYDKNEFVFSASGGASLYRSALLKKIGIFDENFFAYYEDVDISFRAQLAGWLVSYAPKARAYHRISATSSQLGSFTRYHATKNFYMLYAKNMPGWLFWKYLPLYATQCARMFVSSIIHRRFLIQIKSFGKFLTLIPQVIVDRRTIQKNRKVSIAYIDSMLYKKRPV